MSVLKLLPKFVVALPPCGAMIAYLSTLHHQPPTRGEDYFRVGSYFFDDT
jgi:hypothetical protein